MIRYTAIIVCVYAVASAGLLDDGNRHYENGEYSKAVRAYRRALDAGENPALVRFNLGNTWYQMGRLSAAAVSYQAAVREAPEFFRAYLNLGILYYNLDYMAGTVAVLEHARKFEPDNVQALLILAAAYRNLQEPSKAVPLLEWLLEIDPSLEDGYFLLFDINRELDDPEGARKWLVRAPDAGRRAADKYHLLAELTEQLSGPADAAFYYRRLVELAPERSWPRYYYVRNQHQQGNTLVALELADEALDRFGDFAELALLAGSIAFDAQLYRKAERYYAKAYALGKAGGLVGLQNLVKMYESRGAADGVARVAGLIAGSGR